MGLRTRRFFRCTDAARVQMSPCPGRLIPPLGRVRRKRRGQPRELLALRAVDGLKSRVCSASCCATPIHAKYPRHHPKALESLQYPARRRHHVTELTYLLFLKMMKETEAETQLPKGYRWDDLTKKEGTELLEFYKVLR